MWRIAGIDRAAGEHASFFGVSPAGWVRIDICADAFKRLRAADNVLVVADSYKIRAATAVIVALGTYGTAVEEQFAERARLEQVIREGLQSVGYSE